MVKPLIDKNQKRDSSEYPGTVIKRVMGVDLVKNEIRDRDGSVYSFSKDFNALFARALQLIPNIEEWGSILCYVDDSGQAKTLFLDENMQPYTE